MRISDWSSDVCSSDLTADRAGTRRRDGRARPAREILGRCQQGRVPFDGMTTLFHISDLHFGLEDPAALAWVADCVRREARSEERRVGKAGFSTCRSRGWTYH